MKRRVPRLATDEEAEAFLDSDLSDLDFSQFKSGRLRFDKGSKSGRATGSRAGAATARNRQQPLDAEAIQELKTAADSAWAEASKHLDEWLRLKRNETLVGTPEGRRIFAKSAKEAAAAADRFLRNWRKLKAAINEYEDRWSS